MTILEEARHSLIVIEHDPMHYEDAQGMIEYVCQGLHDAEGVWATGKTVEECRRELISVIEGWIAFEAANGRFNPTDR